MYTEGVHHTASTNIVRKRGTPSTPLGLEKYCSKALKFTSKRIYSRIQKKIKAIRINVTLENKIAVEFRNEFIHK
jgi:hypothetical protein